MARTRLLLMIEEWLMYDRSWEEIRAEREKHQTCNNNDGNGAVGAIRVEPVPSPPMMARIVHTIYVRNGVPQLTRSSRKPVWW